MNIVDTCLKVLLFLPLWSLSLAAESDLICRPRGVFDAGFGVHAEFTEKDVLDATITAISGWGGDKTEYKGPSFLISERIDGMCIFKLVDRKESPNTTVILRVGGEDVLQRLNGENLGMVFQDKETNVFNKLSCSGTQKFVDLMNSMCK